MRFIQIISFLLIITQLLGQKQTEQLAIFGDCMSYPSLDLNNFIEISKHKISVKEHFGFFRFKEKKYERCNKIKILHHLKTNTNTVLQGDLCGCSFVMKLTQSGDKSTLSIKLSEPSYNRIRIKLSAVADESIFGLGQQHSYVNLKGRKTAVWVQEQGIGAGDQPISSIANVKHAGGSPMHSYAPSPFYISSNGYSLLLDKSSRSIFDFRNPNEYCIEVWDDELSLEFVRSDNPLKLLTAHAQRNGFHNRLPDWAFGSILGLQGGNKIVQEKLDKILDKGSMVSAIWIQDWVGRNRTYVGDQLRWYWEADSSRYPNLKKFISEQNARGIAVLGYINPMMINEGALFEEAAAKGYFVKNMRSELYLVEMTGFKVGLFDLTNPAARTWIKNLIKKNLIGNGFEGWMADFGEALPWDAKLYAGVSAQEFHNLYPVEWAKLNREAIAESGMEGKIAFFSRSAFLGSAAQSSFFWAGDQMTSWQRHDGLPSVVPALLSSGMSGMQVNHADVGGFAGFWKVGGIFKMTRSKKLLKRHIELGAFSPIFRTHEGIIPYKNAQVYDDEVSAFYAAFSNMRKELYPYLRAVEKEAIEFAYPMIRHLYLHYPNDKNCRNLHRQFMLGSEIIVCPQVKKFAKSLKVYLPEGNWKHFFTGKIYSGGGFYNLKTKLGSPAVFVSERMKG
jgi:alpha-glucosidase